MSWSDGVKRACIGSSVRYGDHRGDTAYVMETPSEVRELMRTSEEDMLELHSTGNTNVAVYIDRRHIYAVTPMWTQVENP